ncbi:hypothetical protein [Nocardia sp. NPDC005978]|uniref:hypothetical protein n=1 Tax=unclassified Nocardia TaxID=2637762 RepID=UPI0033B8679C
MTSQLDTFSIPAHIHGYPDLAFGGYVAGVLAGRSGNLTTRVDFRRVVAVDSPLRLTLPENGRTALTTMDGTPLVEATPSMLTRFAPPAPTWAEAEAVTRFATNNPKRAVTDCYGCGSACPPGRGLRLFPWGLRDRDMMAATWTPDAGLADSTGQLPPEVVWSALDCPGGITAFHFMRMGLGAFTAALTATQFEPMFAGVDYISHAWPVQQEGRKYTVGVALSTRDGSLCALAEALWIEPRPSL